MCGVREELPQCSEVSGTGRPAAWAGPESGGSLIWWHPSLDRRIAEWAPEREANMASVTVGPTRHLEETARPGAQRQNQAPSGALHAPHGPRDSGRSGQVVLGVRVTGRESCMSDPRASEAPQVS